MGDLRMLVLVTSALGACTTVNNYFGPGDLGLEGDAVVTVDQQQGDAADPPDLAVEQPDLVQLPDLIVLADLNNPDLSSVPDMTSERDLFSIDALPPCGDGGSLCPNGLNCCATTCSDPVTDVNNCGFCGVACATQHGTPTCVLRRCAIGTCDLGWADCNGVVADGCEKNIGTDLGSGCP